MESTPDSRNTRPTFSLVQSLQHDAVSREHDVDRYIPLPDGGLTPYLHVRADLWAKVTRAIYYDLVELGEERIVEGCDVFGVASGSQFFTMADAKQVRGGV